MDMNTARQIAERVAQLAECVAAFHATYGHDVKMTTDSPRDAWDKHSAILSAQMEIAALLDLQALQTPFSRYGEWWTRRDVMDTAIVKEMAIESFNLIGSAAYAHTADNAYSSLVIQQSIAGMLHPTARKGLDDATEVNQYAEAS